MATGEKKFLLSPCVFRLWFQIGRARRKCFYQKRRNRLEDEAQQSTHDFVKDTFNKAKDFKSNSFKRKSTKKIMYGPPVIKKITNTSSPKVRIHTFLSRSL
jgi:hypothetical protein